MEIKGVIWREEIIDKLAVKHGVETWEVEEVVLGSPRIRFRKKGYRAGEDLYTATGQSEAGRYLLVVLIYKPVSAERPVSQSLILSARYMTETERRQYERK